MLNFVTSDVKNMASEDLLSSGVDKNIFEAVNNVKKTLLEKFLTSKLRGRTGCLNQRTH
jgi:hypothetical protein